MNDYSMAIVVGRLRSNPKLVYTNPGGIPFLKLRLAVNRQVKDTAKPEGTVTRSVVTVEVWRRLAELCAQFLKRGRCVLVVGSLKSTSAGLTVTADRVQFLGAKDTLPTSISPAIADAIARLAAERKWSTSLMIAQLLEEVLKSRGELK